MFNKPEWMHKMLTGLNQKVRGQAERLQRSSPADDAPPAERRDPSPDDQEGERRNLVVLPQGKANRKGSRQGSGSRMREQANAVL
jgi:hypothetical protein